MCAEATMEKYQQSYAYSITFQRRVHVLHPFVRFLEGVDPVDLFIIYGWMLMSKIICQASARER